MTPVEGQLVVEAESGPLLGTAPQGAEPAHQVPGPDLSCRPGGGLVGDEGLDEGDLGGVEPEGPHAR